ncbi:MAG: Lrp/AsnC ligand binding domain-containing protein [Bacteroidia bacterium]
MPTNEEKNPSRRTLDELDRALLRRLQQDARSTHKELAALLGLSVTPVYERVRRLEREGYIRSYRADLDRHLLDKGLMVFCAVSLVQHHRDMLQDFEARVQTFAEVVACYHVTGAHDYLLHVLVGDMADYQNFVMNRLATLPHIGKVESAFVMTEVKPGREIPV